MNIRNPQRKLEIVISSIVATSRRNTSIDFVDEDILHRIVVTESTKAYHTKQIDEENKYGFFITYKSLNETIANIIQEINPEYRYPRALAVTLLEMANNHIYFAQHMPSLTDITLEGDDLTPVEQLLTHFAFGQLNSPS